MINLKKIRNFKVNHEVYEKLKFGIFCLNKCKNITSAQTLEIVKISLSLVSGKPANKLKLGHGGTLDSSATGVLVIGTGNGCKHLSSFLHGPKHYIVTGKFGVATDTYNSLGKITHQGKFCNITQSKLISCIEKFKGTIFQVPPPYCALKRRGERISDLVSGVLIGTPKAIIMHYKDAYLGTFIALPNSVVRMTIEDMNAGKEVVLAPRIVECHSIELLKFNLPYFTMSIHCGGGFYVRSLIHDLGIALGSFAHVEDLCRSQQGPLTLQDCLSCGNISLETIVSAIERLHMKYGILNEKFGFKNC